MHARPTPPPILAPSGAPGQVPAALAQVLDVVARTDLGAPGWEELTERARTVTAELAVRGLLPVALVVASDDPPVVTARSLLVAARAAATPPAEVVARCA